MWGKDVAVKGMALDPADAKKLFAIADNGGAKRVNWSADSGFTGSWIDVTGTLAANYRPLSVALETRAIAGGTRQFLSLGTDAGVFVGENKARPGATPNFDWKKLDGTGATKMPPVRVEDLVIQDYAGGNDRVLAAATYGRSAWKIDLLKDGKAQALASLSGQGWRDLDANGLRDASDPVLANVGVQLRQGSTVVATATTDAEGWYQFDGVADGAYTVRFTAPTGLGFTLQDQGGDDWLDSDPNTTGDASVTVAGVSLWNVDAGFVTLPGTVAGTVWRDLNANGQRDMGELGLGGFLVRLLDADTKAIVGTATTNALGDYVFSQLAADRYYLELVPPPGWSLTTPNVGDDSKDSDFDPATKATALFDVLPGGFLDFNAGLLFGPPPPGGGGA
ncbi:MAG: MSCRAMM family adhesin SdrC [Gemmataceae bacterium]|nr:MSCRAMM family adhesin SdrC [Gemmataceae bacterium]